MDHQGSYSFRARLEPDEYSNLPSHLGLRKDSLSKSNSWGYRHFNSELWKKIKKILQHNVGKDYNNTISYIIRKYSRKKNDKFFVSYALHCFCERTWRSTNYFRNEKGILVNTKFTRVKYYKSKTKLSTSERKKAAMLRRREKKLYSGRELKTFWDAVLKASNIKEKLKKHLIIEPSETF